MLRQRIKNSGFTLIEILVVIAIIAVMSAAIVFGLSPQNPRQALETEAHRFMAKLQLASEEATFQGELLGVVFSSHDYQMMRWVETDLSLKKEGDELENNTAQLPKHERGHWEKAGQEAFYKKVILPKEMEFRLTTNNESIALLDSIDDETEKNQEPNLLLLPSGEITPFTLIFAMKNNSSVQVSLQGNELGELSIRTAAEKSP